MKGKFPALLCHTCFLSLQRCMVFRAQMISSDEYFKNLYKLQLEVDPSFVDNLLKIDDNQLQEVDIKVEIDDEKDPFVYDINVEVKSDCDEYSNCAYSPNEDESLLTDTENAEKSDEMIFNSVLEEVQSSEMEKKDKDQFELTEKSRKQTKTSKSSRSSQKLQVESENSQKKSENSLGIAKKSTTKPKISNDINKKQKKRKNASKGTKREQQSDNVLTKCEICHKEVKKIIAHMRQVHAESRDFLCSICSATFKTKRELSQHSQHHEKRFRCKVRFLLN